MSRKARVSIRDRVRYSADNALVRGIWVVLLWVGLALLGVIIAIGVVIWAFGTGPEDSPVPLFEAIWISLTRSLDPGTFGQDLGHKFRLAGLVVTIAGLLAVALLIGLVSNAVDRRLESLRRGRSIVIEQGHTLILGFSGKLPLVIDEFIEANESDKRHAIVLVTPEDKLDLEERLKRDLKRSGHNRIVVRRGEPASLSDLAQGRPELAKNIVILRPDEPDADAEVVKCVMAVARSREGLPVVPIVAEFSDAATARAVRQALPGQVLTVVTSEVVARVAAQTSRAAGLGAVYEDLLDFAGDETYICDPPSWLIGRNFGEALLASDNCSVIGLMDQDGGAVICPDFSRLVTANDRLVIIATDDSSIAFRDQAPDWTPESELAFHRPTARVERILAIGWNEMAPRIFDAVDHTVAPGSSLVVVVDDELMADMVREAARGLGHQTLQVIVGSTIDLDVIDGAIAMGPFDHVIVLCAHAGLTPAESDARALLTLMHVRTALGDEARATWRTNVVTEVMQGEAVDLARIANPDDFIVSQRLVSLLIAQLAERPERQSVLREILDADGSQVMLLPSSTFLAPGTYAFETVVTKLREHGVIALGWRLGAGSRDTGGTSQTPWINPRKSEKVTFDTTDELVVIAR